jgi:DNA-binding NarL/FixJ family response regulator
VVRAVAVSSDNSIYTGGYEEFGIWKRDLSGDLAYTSLSRGLTKNELHNDDIWRIWVTDSLVYFQSFSHIYTYDNREVKVFDAGNSNLIFLMKVYDELWVQKIRNGLFRLGKNTLKEIPGSSIFASTEVRVVLPFPNNQYLVGTSTMGFYIYNGDNFKKWDADISEIGKQYEINCGILKKNGNYFIGTILNGVYEVDKSGQIINHFSTDHFLQNNTLLALFEDTNGNIWTALDRGISYIQFLRGMDCYVNPSGKIGAVYSAAFSGDKLFLGTNQGVFYVPRDQLNQPGSLSQLEMVDQTKGQIWDIRNHKDKLICGHNYGLKIIDKNLNVTSQPCTGVYKITDFNYKGEKYFFLGTYFIARIMSEKYEMIYSFRDIPEPIISIESDHLGNIWLGHAQKGLYHCRLNKNLNDIKYLGHYGAGMNEDQYNDLKVFKLGNRIVFEGDDKFYIYDDLQNKMIEYEKMNSCFKGIHALKNIVTLSENLFFAITGNCIYKFFYDGYDFRIIDRFDIGYNNLSLVNMYENAVALDDSLSLICLDNGFLLHNSQVVLPGDSIIAFPYIRSITSMNAKGKKQFLSPGEINNDVPYSRNTILFTFSSKDILAKNLFFQYQLEGVTNDWSKPAKINEILFERLPKGYYTFMLRTVDNLGNHSEPVLFSFTVLPPWYANPWTFIGYFFIFVILMLIIWFMILRRYRNIHLLKIRMREEQRLRRQNLNLRKEIEEKNEELFAQTSFIIQKNELIMKVKKEIDDFYNSYSGKKILSPLYLKVESLLNRNMDIDEDWKMFLIQFEQKHTGFFKHLKDKYPELTPHDLKLCACLKLNLSSKDIASLLNISLRGVENSRYRLRKKLKVSPEQNLTEFFLDFGFK